MINLDKSKSSQKIEKPSAFFLTTDRINSPSYIQYKNTPDCGHYSPNYDTVLKTIGYFGKF